MEIQVSVIIWTVICFVLLMLILRNLLFKPMLELMDKRNQRIADARQKKLTAEKLEKENEERLLAHKKALLEERAAQEKSRLRQLQLEGKKQTDLAQKQCLARVKHYKEHITDEYDEIVSNVAPEMETAAAIFAKNIISHRI